MTSLLLSGVGLATSVQSQPGAVVQTTQVPTRNLTGAASDGKTLWVADRKDDVIHAIDIKTGKALESFEAPGFRPVGLAFDGEKLWIGDHHFNKAFQVDLSSKEVVAEIPLPGSAPRGLAHDGTHLWVADHKEGRIFKVATSDGTIVHDFEVPARGVTGLAWHDGWLWSAGRLDDEIYMIDPDEGLVINVLPSPGPYPWGLAVVGKKLLCADYQNGDVAHVELKPADKAWARSDAKEYEVEYTIDLYNYGKDALTSAQMWVALPEERENQEVLDGPVFSKKPHDRFKTSTGQKYVRWLFGKLAAPGKLQVSMKHSVRLHAADWFLDPSRVQGKFPKDIKKVYLADSEKYLVEDPYIQKVVTAVVGDEKNPYWKARRLFEWEIEKLEYKLAGGHENAPKVLQRGNGSCSEYTFSYVSLCRAAGVPARYVGSIVVRKDDASVDDVFHRWAEVYLPPYGWVPVDVNHGDKPDPRGRALGFGHLTNNLLVTTVEGPRDENRLGWSYNSATTWTYKGSAKVYEEPIAEWRPLEM
jgi:transglutaminase-like putative cysteine protease/glutamine cyclotransferase